MIPNINYETILNRDKLSYNKKRLTNLNFPNAGMVFQRLGHLLDKNRKISLFSRKMKTFNIWILLSVNFLKISDLFVNFFNCVT